MKRHIAKPVAAIFCLLFAATTLWSCESWLEEKSYSTIVDTNVKDSNDGAKLWVAGVYNYKQMIYVYDEFPRSIELDNDYSTGATWAYGEMGAGNFQGQTRQGDVVWKLNYELINASNEAIFQIGRMTNLTERQKNNHLGEMYTLQAYSYFMIVQAYGPCPLFTRSINQGENAYQPRQPIENIYAHIIKLLDDAKDMLYTRDDRNEFEEGHVCAAAAASLLAKVYAAIGSASMPTGETITVKGGTAYTLDGSTRKLTEPQNIVITKDQVAGYGVFDSEEYYRKALDLATEIVINKKYGEHTLIPYSELWSRSGRDSREHFFALFGKSGDDNLGNLFGRAYCGQLVDGYVPSGGGLSHGQRFHWYRLFEDHDLRIVNGVQHRFVRQNDLPNGGGFYPPTEEWRIKATGKDDAGNQVGDGNPVAPFNDGRTYGSAVNENYIAYTTKFADVSDRSIARWDAMMPLMRYADVVLILAEASNEVNGPNTVALQALNDVRARSLASAKNITDGTETGGLSTKEAFRSAVLEERARELAYESNRRWDLIRWGIYLQTMNAIGPTDEVNISKVREKKHLLYPIPQAEIQSNKAITENNYGWL